MVEQLSLTFRTARPADADRLTTLERSASMAALGSIFGPDHRGYPTDDVLARWTIVLSDPDATTLLAYDGDTEVGYACFDSVELRHFGVHPDQFGSGAADALHRQVIERLVRDGIQAARLWVLRENRRARRFYERNGWRPDGRRERSEFPPHPEQVGYSLTFCQSSISSPAST